MKSLRRFFRGGLVSFLFCSWLYLAQAQNSPIHVVSIESTGYTTGEIAVLTVENTADIVFYSRAQLFYIPSKGKYQDYVGRIDAGVALPPGRSQISVNGYCTDVYRPAIPEGQALPEVTEWVGFLEEGAVEGEQEPAQTVLPGLIFVRPYALRDTLDRYAAAYRGDGLRPLPEVDETAYRPSWPGTRKPIRYRIPLEEQPEVYAPVLLEAFLAMEEAVIRLQANSSLNTPFSADSLREHQAVLQQTLWIYAAGLKGQSYTHEQFAERLYEQFEDKYGQPLRDLPKEQKQQLDEGIDDFWAAFALTGKEAKVLLSADERERPKAEMTGCAYVADFSFNPEVDVDISVSEHWRDEEERSDICRKAEEALRAGLSPDASDAYARYAVVQHPTSVLAFWRSNHVGGWASAYARTLFLTGEDTEWVWVSEQMQADAEGESVLSMQMDHDASCRAVVVGGSRVFMKAQAKVFDAVGHDPNQLRFLDATRWLARQALLYLVESSAGLTEHAFGRYVREAATDEVEGVLRDHLEEQAIQMLEQLMASLGLQAASLPESPAAMLEQIRTSVEQLTGESISEFDSAEQLAEYLEENLEENLLDELMGTVEEGIDAVLNMLVWSNTYATADGSLVVHVGDRSAQAVVSSKQLYLRRGYESSEDAVRGGNENCDELLLTHAQADALEIKTQGFSRLSAQAEGNGTADAQLYSIHFEVLLGICFCPGEPPQLSEPAYQIGWYLPKGAAQPTQEELNELAEGAARWLQSEIDAGNLNRESSLEDWSDALGRYLSQACGRLEEVLFCE